MDLYNLLVWRSKSVNPQSSLCMLHLWLARILFHLLCIILIFLFLNNYYVYILYTKHLPHLIFKQVNQTLCFLNKNLLCFRLFLRQNLFRSDKTLWGILFFLLKYAYNHLALFNL